MAQAAAGVHQVLTAEQQRVQQEALVIAKEMAYRQLIADLAIEIHRPQAQALHAEMTKLCTEFNKVYSIGAVQRSTAALAATLGVGAGMSASTSTPLLSRLALHAPTVPVETPEQKK